MAKRALVILCVAVLSLAVTSILLTRRVTRLSEAYALLQQRASQPYRGYVVPTIRAATVAGDTVLVGETRDTNQVQVVYVFTTTCPYCRATLPVWEAIADSARRMYGARVEVIALSLDSTRVTAIYAESNWLPYVVGFFPDWKAARHFRARVVPQTLVLNRVGQVLYAHIGQLGRGPGLDSLYLAVEAGLASRSPALAAEVQQSTR